MCFARTDLASADGTLAGAMMWWGINTALHRSGREDGGGGEFGHDLYYAAGLVDPKNPPNVLLALPPAHYM